MNAALPPPKQKYRVKFQNPVTGAVETAELDQPPTPELMAPFMQAAGERSRQMAPSAGAKAGMAGAPPPELPPALQAKPNPMGGPPILTGIPGKAKPTMTALQAGQKIDVKQEELANRLGFLDMFSPFRGTPIAQFVRPSQIAAATAFTPVQAYASATILGDEKSSWQDRLGATVELAMNVGGADTLLAQSTWKGAKALRLALKEKNANKVWELLDKAPKAEVEKIQLKLRENFGRQGEEVKALPSAEAVPPGGYRDVPVETPAPMSPQQKAGSRRKIGGATPPVEPKPAKPVKLPRFLAGPEEKPVRITPKAKPAPVAPETPKATVSEAPPVAPPDTGKTNISLAEAARHDLSPDAPSPQSWDQWQSEAVAKGHNTPEGAQKILDKAKKGVEPTPDETFGLGMHVADLLETAGKATGEERTKLIDRAREIYSIRHTQSARNIAARAALHQGEYKPKMVDALYELETGKPPDAKTSARINKQAERVQAETEKINKISTERQKVRSAATPKFVEKGTPEQRIAKARAVIERKYPRRITGGYIDPDMLEPVAAMLRAKTEQLRGNVSRAVTELRNELSATYGWKVTDDDLFEAFQNVKKKKSLTEAEIRARNARARATSAINREIEAASQPKIVKFARGTGRLSQEMRMADLVNRGIDFASNADEVVQSSAFSPVERLAANAYLAATKDPTRFRGMSVAQRAAISHKWAAETADAVADAAGASGGRQSGHFTIMGTLAGVLDAPTRAFNELRYAGEIAADLAKKNPHMDFSDVVDQIRQPAIGGPLGTDDALRYHEGMYKWGDAAMHTDENAISKARGAFRGMFVNASPAGKAVGETLDWFLFSFSKSLVNIADKGAQTTVLPYGVARSVQTATAGTKFGLTLTKNLDKTIRAKQLAQTIRRTAVGYGLMQAGYYWKEIQSAAKENGIDAPDQPDWMKGRIIETLDKNQKPTGNIYHEESYPAQILGVMFAMSAGAKARELDDYEAAHPGDAEKVAGLKRRQWVDWLTNNTAWNQLNSITNMVDPKAKAETVGQGAIAMMVRMFTPSGFAKWAKSEDDVPSRQTKPQKAEGNLDWIGQAIVNELKNRTPSYWGINPENRQTLPPKSQVIK